MLSLHKLHIKPTVFNFNLIPESLTQHVKYEELEKNCLVAAILLPLTSQKRRSYMETM